jgi:hypothetical protein
LVAFIKENIIELITMVCAVGLSPITDIDSIPELVLNITNIIDQPETAPTFSSVLKVWEDHIASILSISLSVFGFYRFITKKK